MGRDQDVLIMTSSEFGRRLSENGTANQMFLLGSSLVPGLYGTYPGLQETDLDGIGDSVVTVDFRSIYASVLSNWLGVDSEPLLGESFPGLGFV